jgi:hypothetical protein
MVLRAIARALLLLAVLGLLQSAVAQETPPIVRILASDPPPGGVLSRGEELYLRIHYRSDIPLRFQVEGYFDGDKPRGAQSNTVPAYPAGEGEALVWLAFRHSTYLDQVQLKVMSQHWKLLDTLAMPVSIAWRDSVASAPRVSADWVARLSQAQADLARESVQAARAAADDEGWSGFGLVILLMGWSIPGYIVLQIHALRKYREGWRRAALVPLIATIPAFGHAAIALAANSNLWPLVMLFVTPLAFLYLVGLALVRRVRS